MSTWTATCAGVTHLGEFVGRRHRGATVAVYPDGGAELTLWHIGGSEETSWHADSKVAKDIGAKFVTQDTTRRCA